MPIETMVLSTSGSNSRRVLTPGYDDRRETRREEVLVNGRDGNVCGWNRTCEYGLHGAEHSEAGSEDELHTISPYAIA